MDRASRRKPSFWDASSAPVPGLLQWFIVTAVPCRFCARLVCLSVVLPLSFYLRQCLSMRSACPSLRLNHATSQVWSSTPCAGGVLSVLGAGGGQTCQTDLNTVGVAVRCCADAVAAPAGCDGEHLGPLTGDATATAFQLDAVRTKARSVFLLCFHCLSSI
eukprot:SAG22_NODE_6046_length_910_cov_1.172626_1_plen_161_part_00